MKQNIKKHVMGLLGFMVVAVGLIVTSETTYAIETTLTVSPMEQKMTLYPGENSTGSVTVSNQASATEKLYYKVSVVPFTRVGDKYETMVGDELVEGKYNNIVDWVTLSAESGSLDPNERDEIIYSVNVPQDARGGGQYFAILVTRTDDPEAKSEEGNANLKEIIQIASTVYASVAGNDVKLAGSISENEISAFLLAPPIKSSFKVENTGNTHMEIDYYMQVFPLFSDEEIYTNEENPSHALVLPETTRYLSQEWNETPGIGIFKVRQVASYGSEGEQSVAEKMGIVCPVWLLFLILFIIIAIIIWIVTRVRSRGKNARKVSASESRAE